jgi:hypothetical protein
VVINLILAVIFLVFLLPILRGKTINLNEKFKVKGEDLVLRWKEYLKREKDDEANLNQ